MDPVNQTTTTVVNTDGTTTPISPTTTFIAGAFGGINNTVAPISDTLPAFSFDENDFGVTNTTIPTPARDENIADPFASGINSIKENNINYSTPIIENNPITQSIPDGTFSLDNLTQPESTQPIYNQAQESEVSFDLPPTTQDQIPSFDNSKNNTTPPVENNPFSFELPTTAENIAQEVTPLVQESYTIEESETIPETSITNNGEEEMNTPIDFTENNTADYDTPISIEEEINTNDNEQTEEEEEINTNETIPTEEVSESRQTSTHELQESYSDFQTAVKNYTTFKNNESITITGLRTDEEEINYTFTISTEGNISITKSNTNDILSFSETESGLQTYINEDMIGYYGIDQVDPETTHYLKEKLGKFTMMLESEHEKEIRKKKESMRQMKENIRNF